MCAMALDSSLFPQYPNRNFMHLFTRPRAPLTVTWESSKEDQNHQSLPRCHSPKLNITHSAQDFSHILHVFLWVFSCSVTPLRERDL